MSMTADQLNQYVQQYGSAMTPSNGNQGLNEFLNSSQYQLMYGNSPSAQSTDPNVRFQNDPGVQNAIQAGLPALQAQYAQKGLGASGAAANGLSQNMYNNYNSFIGTQGSAMTNYQNQLAALAGTGQSAANNAASATNTDQTGLASLIAQLNSTTGTQSAQSTLGSSENIATLLANLGVNQSNAFLNTGAAMSNNMLAGSQLGAQLANAAQQSAAQTKSSALQGQGALNGASALTGGGGSF